LAQVILLQSTSFSQTGVKSRAFEQICDY